MGKKKKLKFDFISSSVLEEKPLKKRIKFILNRVKDGTILVTDGVMTPEEEMELIKETMRRVDSGFPGIEVASLRKPVKGMERILFGLLEQKEKLKGVFSFIIGKKSERTILKNGITLIGPARYIKKIKKNPNSFSVLAGV